MRNQNIRNWVNAADNPTVGVEEYTVSAEWFFNKKKSIEQDQSPEEDIYDVLSEWSTRSKQPYTPREGNVALGKRDGAFFQRNGHSVADVVKELHDDINHYTTIFNHCKPLLMQLNKSMAAMNREFDQFLTADTYPEGAKAFVALAVKWTEPFKTTVMSRFTEPHFTFLGFGNQSFTRPSDGGKEFIHDPGVLNADEITIPALSTGQLLPFQTQLKTLAGLIGTLDHFKDELYIGFDATDPPFRGYGDDIPWDTVSFNYLHPTYDNENTYIITNLLERCNELFIAMVNYLNKSTQ